MFVNASILYEIEINTYKFILLSRYNENCVQIICAHSKMEMFYCLVITRIVFRLFVLILKWKCFIVSL